MNRIKPELAPKYPDKSTQQQAEKIIASGDARVIYSSFVAELATQAWAEGKAAEATA